MNQLKDYEIERLCDRFAEELVNWSYDSGRSGWIRSKKKDSKAVMDFDFGNVY